MDIKIAVRVLMLIVLSSGLAFAGQTCVTATVIPSDGRIVDFDFVASGTTNFYQFGVTIGHSYSVEVREDYDDPPSQLKVALDSDTGCSTPLPACTTPGASGCTVDTHSVDPALTANASRQSFTSGSNGTYAISVINGPTSGRYVAVSVSETTLYSPDWTSQGNFFSVFRLANTTNGPIHGNLEIFDSSGALVGQTAVILPISGSALCYTAQGSSVNCNNLNPPRGKSGFALFTHDGPPGAVQAAAFTENFSDYPSPFSEPITFGPVRQGK